MSEQNKSLVRHLIEDHWNAKNPALVLSFLLQRSQYTLPMVRLMDWMVLRRYCKHTQRLFRISA
jgi:hypothetical protein